MSVRTPSEIARNATNTFKSIRHASTTAAPAKKKRPQVEHGQQIFVYHHLQKNNIVYSLSKALNNNASLRQLPYNGKKTIPSALRKDLWHPFATISFPPGSGSIGLSAFQKLREYRRRHELEWDQSMFADKDGKFVERKKQGRLICDQKANSVADMAAVLGRLSLKDSVKEGEDGSIGLKGEGTGERVEVTWRDLNDAEFAETWSDNVEHGLLELKTNNRDMDKIWGKKKWVMDSIERGKEERRARRMAKLESGEIESQQPDKLTL